SVLREERDAAREEVGAMRGVVRSLSEKLEQGLVQRLSEELERQGQAVNHHAKVICQRESELEAALDRANRAHDELIAMEPP
ncbi:unnamed protein product, partial [Ascophyllum nodosum]